MWRDVWESGAKQIIWTPVEMVHGSKYVGVDYSYYNTYNIEGSKEMDYGA